MRLSCRTGMDTHQDRQRWQRVRSPNSASGAGGTGPQAGPMVAYRWSEGVGQGFAWYQTRLPAFHLKHRHPHRPAEQS